ncbi:MAG: dTDP-4-dehydrorhamnose reductase [Alphaproteobacteria bacterium PA3]|nr:MAG: dTDP-4-dehydrorhamnose reductase [Alphaproteobacteria bacterium PA3]
MRLVVFGQNGQLAQALRSVCSNMAVPPVYLGRAQCDVTNAAQVADCLKLLKPNAVINTAAYTAVETAEAQIAQATALNAQAPQMLAEITSRLNIALLHLSTDYVFDGTKSAPYVENDAPNPLNVYGRSKLKGEEAVRDRNPEALIIRTSWVFSPFAHNFVRTILQRAAKGEALSVVDDQIGTPTAALDLAEACVRAIKAKLDGSKASGIYHYASSGETSWFGLANAILQHTQAWRDTNEVALTAIGSEQFKTQAVRPKNSRLNSEAFVRQFGHRQPTWQESLAGTLSLLETEFSAKWRAP